MKNFVVLDCEVYPNYFLAAFKNIDNEKIITIESRGADKSLTQEAIKKLNTIMHKRTTFGFNSNKYDMPIILFALAGKTCRDIHKLSDYIIHENSPNWQTMKRFDLTQPKGYSHFDISDPAPGVMVSLKLYGGRMNSKRLQDLPISPGTMLTEHEMDETLDYCINDLNTTIDLYRKVEDRIKLRYDMSEQYGVDLRSKSDAQIAEVVIKSELTKKFPGKRIKRPTIKSSTTFKYAIPSYIKFESKQLNEALDFMRKHFFELDKKGSIKLPKELKSMKIDIGESRYQLGIGGIHSTEHNQAVTPKDSEILCDRDVASYYPAIILNLRLYPRHLGESFLDIYQGIVDERLEAKRSGNLIVNQSLKIVINGSFGKLGSKWSIMYAPDLMMTVTMTGQLALLMLIERLEIAGIKVISANTDGFVSIMDKSLYETYDDICFQWELDTAFELEETRYQGLYSRDVNNYVALTEHGAKGKGIFNINQITKNPAATICITAVTEYLTKDKDIEETIRGCEDITQFLTVRSVTGGAVWRGQYLGRVVRWIYSTDGEKITYKKNGNKVPKSDGSRPVMEIGGMEQDIDYMRYIEEAHSILEDIGF
jgi:DNA polymerase elongation subunit (family B)